MVSDYIHNLRSKLELSQKIIQQNPDFNQLENDNTHIIHSINKNLQNLTKNDSSSLLGPVEQIASKEEFIENIINNINHSTTAIENNFLDETNNITLKSTDFYVKKKTNSTYFRDMNHSMSSSSMNMNTNHFNRQNFRIGIGVSPNK